MKLILIFVLIVTFTCTVKPFCIDNFYRGKSITGKKTDSSLLKTVFQCTNNPLDKELVTTNPLHLQEAARDTLTYLDRCEQSHGHLISPHNFCTEMMSTESVKNTLRYIIDLIEEDKKTGIYRILDPDFLNRNFSFLKWSTDKPHEQKHKEIMKPGKLYITHYAAYCLNGSYKKTAHYKYPLYQKLNTEKNLPYTKQQVLSGLFNKKEYKEAVKPLVWLTRQGLEDALLQGTIFVKMPDNKLQGFKIFQHNGFAYDKTIKDPKEQRRYWYFRQIPDSQVKKQYDLFERRKQVIFAGDIHSVGIGKIIAMSYQDRVDKKQKIQLGVLADTGNAFCNNMRHLDFFIGIVPSYQQMLQEIKPIPNQADAYILSKCNSTG